MASTMIGYGLYTCITTRMSSTGNVDCLMGHVRGSLSAARASVNESQGPLTHAVIFGFNSYPLGIEEGSTERGVEIVPLLNAGNFASTRNPMDFTAVQASISGGAPFLYSYVRATFPIVVRHAVLDKLAQIRETYREITEQGRRSTEAYSSSVIPVRYQLH